MDPDRLVQKVVDTREPVDSSGIKSWGDVLDLTLEEYVKRNKKQELKLFEQEVKRKPGEGQKNHFKRLIDLFEK